MRWLHFGGGVLLVWLLSGAVAQAQDKATLLKNALALQTLVQQLIQDAEPAIACILVSRSDAYQRYGQGPTTEYPGKLGGFDAGGIDTHLRKLGLPREDRERLLKQLDLADTSNPPESFGSGIVLDAKGLVLTNYHVVRDAAKIFVRLPGSKSSYAEIYAADPRSDLAVLRLLTPPAALKTLRLGDGGKVERGEFVLLLANPFAAGFHDGQPSASLGIISNLRRRLLPTVKEEERGRALHHYGTLLQTDVRLHAGCSGGALLNLQGEVIGLTSALAALHGSDVPGGFAIPLDVGVRRILEVLLRGGEVEYAFLGVGVEPQQEPGDGVKLTYITPGSPAERAGLKPTDELLAIDGSPVRTSEGFFLELGLHLAGTSATLELRSAQGAVRKAVVELAKYYVPGKTIATFTERPYVRGLRVDYTSLLVQQPRTSISTIPPGVLVSDVLSETPAATALLRPGEVITHVNGRAVDAPRAFYREMRNLAGPIELTLFSPPGQAAPKVTLN